MPTDEILKGEVNKNLASNFENFTSTHFNENEIFFLSFAPLSTNESVDFPNLLEGLGARPNGYICGVGAGNIFSMFEMFDVNSPPKALLSVDLSPEVVLTGRVTARLLKNNPDFNSFLNSFKKHDEFISTFKLLIDSEKSKKVRKSFNEIDLERLYFSIVDRIYEMPERGIITTVSLKEVVSPLACIRENWFMIKNLADEDKIGFGFGSFYDKSIMKYFKNLPGFSKKQNLIYTSNILDYPKKGLNLKKYSPKVDSFWSAFKETLKPMNSQKDIFVFSTYEGPLNLLASKGIEENPPKGLFSID